MAYHCSSGIQGAALASLTPGVNIIRMILIGSGMMKDEATVKSMSRHGDRRYNNHNNYTILVILFMFLWQPCLNLSAVAGSFSKDRYTMQ